MNKPDDLLKLRDRPHQSEERLRPLFEAAPVAYHQIDGEGRINWVNRAECAMLGYDASELIGQPVWELAPPPERGRVREATIRKLAGDASLAPFRAQLLCKHGPPVTVEFYESPIEDESGKISGIRALLIDITQREQAMEAILAAELKFRDLFDNVIEGVYQSTAGGRLITANPALVKMLGYDSEAEFLQVDIEALYVQPELRAVRLAQLEKDGELRNCELKLRTKDGREITVLENSRPARDMHGAVSYYEGTLTDISGRALAQEALAKERDFISAIIDAAGSLIAVLDPNGRIVRFNRVCERTSGYSFEEMKGRAFWDVFIIPKEVQPLKDVFAKLRAGSDSIKHENHWRTRAGGLRLIDWSNVALRDKQGVATYIISTGIDITDQRRAEQALRLSEQRYRDLFENANDMVYTHDLRGNFTSINAAAERITGYSRAEALQMNIARIVAPENLSDVRQRIDNKLGGEGSTTFGYEIVSKSGRRVSLEASTRLQMEDGRPIGIHGVARDITDRKLAEEKLESYSRELARKNEELADALAAAKEATELKSRFLATMSHEIRTPLNGILGMTELLISTPLDSEQREYAQAVRHSAEALLTVINDVLDVSKMEAGKLKLERLPFDPRAEIEEAIGLLAPRAAAKGLRLASEAEPALPRIVYGDPGRLRQILLNLIGNAIKFTAEGEVVVTAEMAEDTGESTSVRFSVRDTGIGISPENRLRLFQSFVQGDSSTTRKYGGTGLGLAISKQLVEMMGGTIGVESERGRGSTFTFLVAFGKYRPETAPSQNAAGGKVSLMGCKTLVVDENGRNGAIAREYLTLLGCRAGLSSRSQALQQLRHAAGARDPFRIVLLDMGPPEPDAFSLAQAIGRDPAIAETIRVACSESPIRGDGMFRKFGFSGVLQKPITPSLLQETLLAALEEYGAVNRSV